MCYLPIARLGKPHGRKGAIRVSPYKPFLSLPWERLPSYRLGEQDYILERLKEVGRFLSFHFKGVDSYEAALSLQGCLVAVARKCIPQAFRRLHSGDLVGMEVHDDAAKVFLGQIRHYYAHAGTHGIFELLLKESNSMQEVTMLVPADSQTLARSPLKEEGNIVYLKDRHHYMMQIKKHS